MTDDARWNRDTVPASPGSPSRPSRPAIASPFDPPARDRFEEGEELGRGGMGRVFEARDVALDRAVAIKQSLTDDVAMLARFEREALITARLQHPGIVPVLDAGRDANGRPYYVMRKIEGRPLATVVAEARDASARLALLPNMLAAVDAVAYAHARGVLHRDLKPWNILLGPFGETFVIDWGLARDGTSTDAGGGATISGDDGLTRVGSAMGTPGFMAPEQARGDATDQRADVYALGATLVHLLAGKQPFAGVDPTVAIETVAREAVPAVEFPAEVMPELRTIALKAMAAKRDDRYPDAGALASDLRRFLAGQLVAAHVYTTRERLARWLRKHRLVVAIASIAAIALAAISTYAVRRVIVARDDARAAQLRADDRADQMLVARADSLATTDPAFAVALLKQLAPASRQWPRARLVAETAVAHGVGRGMRVGHGNAYTRIAPSPSGDVVAIFNGDTIQLVEPSLQSPARMFIDHPDGITQFWWLDDESMVVVTDKKAVLRVYRDGRTKPLDKQGNSIGLVMAHGDGRIFAKVDGNLRELDPDGGPPRMELGQVKHAQRVHGALLYSVDNKTLVIARDGMPNETLAVEVDSRMLVANLPQQRLAASSDNDVTEYERTDGVWKERGRWVVDAQHLVYRNNVLIAVEAAGVAYLMPGRPPYREAAAISRDRSVVPGAVVVADEGVFVLGDSAIHALDGGPAEIALYTDRQSSFAKAGPYLVTMARTGLLRSWDLRRFYPRLVSMTKFGMVTVDVNTDRVWFKDGDQLVVYDLASAKLERMRGEHETFDTSTLGCDGPDHSILKLDEQRRDALGQPAQAAVRTRDGAITPIAGDYQYAVCAPPWLALKRTSSIEIRDARTPDRAGRIFEATGPLDGFRVSERWLAMIDKARTVTQVELATGRVQPTFSIGDAVAFAMDEHGRVATTTKDDSVVMWVDGKPRTVAEKLDIAAFHGHRVGFLVFTHDRSVVVIDHDGRVVRYDIGEKALSIASAAPRVAVILDGKVGVLDVRDGSVVRFPWRANTLALSSDGTSIAWTKNDRAGILRLDIPDEPRALLRWLDEVSNATLAPGSTELTWK